jgi:hypothetical protein
MLVCCVLTGLQINWRQPDKDVGLRQQGANQAISTERGILAFGGKVTVVITGGELSDNRGAPVLLLMEQADVAIQSGTVLNSNAHGEGGSAVAARGNSSLTMQDCTVSDNAADSASFGYGGAVLVSDSVRVEINNCTFRNCSVGRVGGAVFASASAAVNITDSVFTSNKAGVSAAGVGVDGRAVVGMLRCNFTRNEATYGGAVVSGGLSKVDLISSNVSRTQGQYGSIFVRETGQIRLVNSMCENNNADYGGCIFMIARAQAFVEGSVLARNKGIYGGAAVTQDGSNLTVSRNSSVLDNTAQYAGGMFAHARSRIDVRDSLIALNTADGEGGGALVGQSAVMTVINTVFCGNRAKQGAAMCAQDSGAAFMEDSRIIDNVASVHGGGLAVSQNATFMVSNTSVSVNSAPVGGAVVVEGAARLVLSHSSRIFDNAGVTCAGFVVRDNATLSLSSGSLVSRNAASRTGGGGCVHDTAALVVSPGSRITGNSAQRAGGLFLSSQSFDPAGLSEVVRSNTATYDRNIGVFSTHLGIVGNASISNFASYLSSATGLLPVVLNVSGAFGLPCEGLFVKAMLDDQLFLGSNLSDTMGLVHLSLKIRKPPGVYRVSFSLMQELLEQSLNAFDGQNSSSSSSSSSNNSSSSRMLQPPRPANMSLQVRSCIAGEVTAAPDACQECLEGTFSLNPSNATCDAAPNGAIAPGGTGIIPRDGYWSSDPQSNQIHR